MLLGLQHVSQAIQRERVALDETKRTLQALQQVRDNNEERARLSEHLVKLGRNMGSKNNTEDLFHELKRCLNAALGTQHILKLSHDEAQIDTSLNGIAKLPKVPYHLLTPAQRAQYSALMGIPQPEEGVAAYIDGQSFACHILIMGRHQSCHTPSRTIFIETATGLMAEALNRATAAEKLLQAKKLEALGRLAAGIAHDFNNLLTAILGSTDLIQVRLESNQDPTPHISVIQDTAKRASGLTHKLMTFTLAKPQSPQDIDLCKLIRDMLPMLDRTIEERIHINTTIPKKTIWIHADPIDIEQIILNLVLNARDAIEGSGTIEINLHADSENQVQICVVDNGIGMAPQVLSKIFEPFFSTHREQGGYGLGLTSAVELAHNWNGDIHAHSTQGGGSTFTVYLPRKKGGQEQTTNMPVQPDSNTEQLRVLVVEDNAKIRLVVEEFLKHHGHLVSAATSGAGGITLLQEHSFDVIISDVVMPEVDGYTLARFAQNEKPNIPIILISGYAPPVNEEIPNVIWLMKPFTQQQLMNTVAQAVQYGKTQQK